MRMRGFLGIFASVCLTLGAVLAAQAQPPINGAAEPQFYGPPLVVQNTQTGFGDNGNGEGFPGSELDVAYGSVSGGNLYLVLSGNLEPNGNKLNLFFDTKSGGQNRLRGDNLFNINNPQFWYLTRLGDSGGSNGFLFDTAFDADYYFGLNSNSGSFFVDYSETPSDGSFRGYFVGKSTGYNGTLDSSNGGFNPYGIQAALNNSNTAGVTGGTSGGAGGNGGTVQTGIELCIPLAAIGNPTRPYQSLRVRREQRQQLSIEPVSGQSRRCGRIGESGGASRAEPFHVRR